GTLKPHSFLVAYFKGITRFIFHLSSSETWTASLPSTSLCVHSLR
ncbi:hypothetical protein MRX96_048920, partial [Rhipicephalus microplus]